MSWPTKWPEQGIEKSDSSIEWVIDAATKMPKTQKNEVWKRLETSWYSDKRETTENKYGIVES